MHTIAVTARDVVTAVEARRTTDLRTVLRLTPPFSGRMCARLHVGDVDDSAPGPTSVHVDPDELLDSGAPPYPRPDETADALRRESDQKYDPERHRERHRAAVEDWRSATAAAIANRVTLDLSTGEQRVDVAVLGTWPETD